jgi:hypothetical protein
MEGIGLAAARLLGKSRKIALFAGLVAAAGLLNELRRRRQESAAA